MCQPVTLKPSMIWQERESCAKRPSTNQAVRQLLAMILAVGGSKRAHLIKSEFSVYGTFIAGRCPRYKAVPGSNSVNSDHHFMEMDGENAIGYESEMYNYLSSKSCQQPVTIRNTTRNKGSIFSIIS